MSEIMCLNGRKYHTWKEKIKDLLFMKKIYLPIFASNKPHSMTDKD